VKARTRAGAASHAVSSHGCITQLPCMPTLEAHLARRTSTKVATAAAASLTFSVTPPLPCATAAACAFRPDCASAPCRLSIADDSV
jgi:hypothetical protein